MNVCARRRLIIFSVSAYIYNSNLFFQCFWIAHELSMYVVYVFAKLCEVLTFRCNLKQKLRAEGC